MSKSIKDLILSSYEELEDRYNHRTQLAGLSTGFYDLDMITDGIKKSELTVIAGRPSVGKTALALNICNTMAKAKVPCFFISYEMRDKIIAQRLLSQEAEVDSQRMRTGMMMAQHWETFTIARNKLGDENIEISGQCQCNFEKLSEEIRKFIKENPDGVIFIDYFQLIKLTGIEDRYVELSYIACSLKHLATELNIPIILMSQVLRKCEDRYDKRPELSEMFECDSLSCHADNVILLYRDEMYDKENTDNKGKAELIVAKNKNGPVGTVEVLFQRNITKFKNITRTNEF